MKRSYLLAGVGLLIVGIVLAILGLRGGGQGQIRLTFIDKPTIMTAAYKVYGDPEAVGGKYWLGKLTLQNEGDGSLRNVRISYQVPDYISWTTPQHYSEILPGQTIVSPFYPRFPESVARITSLTPSSLEVKIEYNDGTGEQSRIERRDFKFRGVQEIEYSSLPPSEILTWYDANDNSELNCAWVTEQDPVVRAYYAKISERSGGFGTMGDAKDLEQLARSTYNFMIATGMTYSGTTGVVEQRGDGWVLVQGMRLPRDVIYGNSGLCVELAQLWASIAMNAGAKAYLVMIPGHCFPVLQTNDFGDSASLLPIESTGIGGAFEGGNLGAPMSFDDAVKVATQNFVKVQKGEIPGIIVDIASYRNQGIRPPEQAQIDQAAFVKMLDDRIKERQQQLAAKQDNAIVQAGNQNQQQQQGGQQQGETPVVTGGGEQNIGQQGGTNPVDMGGGTGQQDIGQQGGGGPIGGGAPWTDTSGRVSLTYPANWIQNPQAVTGMRQILPGYALSVADPSTHCGVDVIFFEGVNDTNTAAQNLSQALGSLGLSVQLGAAQPTQLGGVTGVAMPVTVQSSNGVLASVMAVLPVRGGMVAINFGGPQQAFQASQQVAQMILQSVRVAR